MKYLDSKETYKQFQLTGWATKIILITAYNTQSKQKTIFSRYVAGIPKKCVGK